MIIWALSCDPSTLHLLNVACKEEGHSLHPFNRPEEAPGGKPDLVFIEASGPDIVPKLSALRRVHPDSFIALVTAETLGADNISKLAPLGINAYIGKPPTLSDLAGIIRKAQG